MPEFVSRCVFSFVNAFSESIGTPLYTQVNHHFGLLGWRTLKRLDRAELFLI